MYIILPVERDLQEALRIFATYIHIYIQTYAYVNICLYIYKNVRGYVYQYLCIHTYIRIILPATGDLPEALQISPAAERAPYVDRKMHLKIAYIDGSES
jgi:hypothetical protein